MSTTTMRPEAVQVDEKGPGKFSLEIAAGPHRLVADEPHEVGGDDTGPRPHEFVLAGLGACTAMTLRLYADRKGMPLKHVSVRLTHRKIDAKNCPDCVTTEGQVEEMTREIVLTGDLDDEARRRLLEIADKCPVHRTLTGEIKIRTSLVPA